MQFSTAAVPPDEQACISWEGLTAVAKTKGKEPKTLLSGICGYVEPQNMVAIMGPSGCGKSTLLDILAGRTHSNITVSGNIHVNGKSVRMSYGTVAYVPQEDLLTGTLTVRETLLFTARLRLQLPAKRRVEIVDSLMEELGLSQARDTPVGTMFIKGISGGQKRRLSIAQEVLVSPSVMFLDEPTSGLDAAAAFFCVGALRTLVSQGRSIIMSIHQPSSEVFSLFNYLLLLSRGQMIYFGPSDEAEHFYLSAGLRCPARRSIAEHFIHCMNTDFEKEAADFGHVSEAASREIQPADEKEVIDMSPAHSSEGTPHNGYKQRHIFSVEAVPNPIDEVETSQPMGEDTRVPEGHSDVLTYSYSLPPPPQLQHFAVQQPEELAVESHWQEGSVTSPSTAIVIPAVLAPKEKDNSNMLSVPNAEREISALRQAFESTGPLKEHIQVLDNKGVSSGHVFQGIRNTVSPVAQFLPLVQRMLLNAYRDIGVFWLRLLLYVLLAICLATIFYQLNHTWEDTTSRVGCLFFSISFLTFLAISGFPSFIDEMKVFLRERLNGYYGVLVFTIANTVASLPYLAIISVSCSLLLYFAVGLNPSGGRVIYFMLILFSALTTAEGLMMALAAIVNHSLLGIAAAACILGIFMPVAGFIIPIQEIPRPVWYYPLHFMGYHTYSIHGMLVNEFRDTADIWHCPCEISNNCDETLGPCRITGDQVLEAFDYPTGRSKWIDLLLMFVLTVVFRLMFYGTLKLKEFWAK